jgi:membrane-associated phospholipid phosphatase
MRLLDAVTRADDAVERLLQPTRSSRVLGAVTAVASIAGEAALVGLALARTKRALGRYGLLLVASTVVVERAGTKHVKKRAGRRRPSNRFRPAVALHPHSASFPSRHASMGFLAARLLARGSRWPYAVAGTVSLCRLQQGVHAASDLVVGAAVGVVTGAAAVRLGTRADGQREGEAASLPSR